MNNISNLIKILASPDNKLLMMLNEYIAEIASLAPFFVKNKDIMLSTYQAQKHKEFERLAVNGIRITNDVIDENLKENTLAYYHIIGMITADDPYYFSTKRFEKELLTAEANENISGHFIHISSGGGQAYYLDRLAHTMRSLNKPTYTLIERVCGSAAYYIASQTQHITALTPFDIVGCIGTMVGIMDIKPMLEKWGIRFIEEYATKSDLKNKKYIDLLNGNPNQFITEELDPLQQQFIADVRTMRPVIATLPEDHPVLRGETFYAADAINNGLIDEVTTFNKAITNAYRQATAWNDNQKKRKQALKYL